MNKEIEKKVEELSSNIMNFIVYGDGTYKLNNIADDNFHVILKRSLLEAIQFGAEELMKEIEKVEIISPNPLFAQGQRDMKINIFEKADDFIKSIKN